MDLMPNDTEESTASAKTVRNDDWKMRMKQAKDEKKKHQKLLKEEEARKKLSGPKDSKVVLIDKATLEKISRRTSDAVRVRSNTTIDLSDFPELESPKKRNPAIPKQKTAEQRRRGASHLSPSIRSWRQVVETSKTPEDTFPSLESTLNRGSKKSCEVSGDVVSQKPGPSGGDSSATFLKLEETSASSAFRTGVQPANSKKKKRKDPIVVDLSSVLVKSKTAKKEKRSTVLGSKFRRHADREYLSGNMLDSSNPKRNRGKHRETKRKKLSYLKSVIIKERIIKAKARQKAVECYFQNQVIEINEEVDFKSEIQDYLENLKEIKFKNTERKRATVDKPSTEKRPEEAVIKKTDGGLGIAKLKQNCSAKQEYAEAEIRSSDISPAINVWKNIRFSSKFREYCENIITPSLDSAANELIKELVYLQDRTFARDPIKANAKRRHVVGFREAKKYLRLKKVKMLVVAPDLEKLVSQGSVNDQVDELKANAAAQNIPCVFALDRRKLGYCAKKKVPVSVFAVLSYEGLESRFESVLHNFKEAQRIFNELSGQKEPDIPKETAPDLTTQIISSFISALQEKSETNEGPSPESDQEVNPLLRALQISCNTK